MKTRQGRSESTRAALVEAARALFAERGFAAVGTEEIVARAGVTRGALYHHFRDKTDLFRAVLEEVERDLSEKIATAALSDPDPWRALAAGCSMFLDACREPEIQQIALLDAPSVLGWEEWREIDARYGLGLIKLGIQNAIDAGALPPQPVDPLAHVLLGALDEAAMLVARAEDPARTRAEVGATLDRLLAALSAQGG